MRVLFWGDRSHAAWRRLTPIGIGAALALLPVGCAHRGLSMPIPAAVSESSKAMVVLFGSGTLTTPNFTSKAITYDPDLAPIGAAMTATIVPSSDESTTAEFTVSGLLPRRSYTMYAHTNACGADPDAAGPRFQNRRDPTPIPRAQIPHEASSNPRSADLSNEIWLDERTDIAGAGTSRTTVPFILTDRTPGSVVVREWRQTPTDPGHADNATARIACLTLSKRLLPARYPADPGGTATR